MTDPAARSQRQQAVADLKRGLILDAARRVFERDGLDGASMRAIAREAGYAAGALYFHFDSKEAVYSALLQDSLDRLALAVDSAVQGAGLDDPAARLRVAALGFFDFYAAHPRDLDLGFYLFRGGMQPRGLSPDLNRDLNRRLESALAPIASAARALGAGEDAARAALADVFGHAVGLLLLQHTRRIRLFGCDARALMADHAAAVASRLACAAYDPCRSA